MKRIGIPAAVAVAVLIGAAWWVALSRHAPTPSGQASSTASSAAARDAARGSAVIAIPGQPPVPARPDGSSAISPASLASRDEIRDAPDLKAYYDRVKDLPDPTGERSYHLAEAVFECSVFVDTPFDVLSRKLAIAPSAQQNPRRNAVLAAMVARCKGFGGMGPALREIQQALHARAELAGYPAEVARSLRFEPALRDPERADAAAIGLLTSYSDQPEVLHEISQYLIARNGDRPQQPGPDAQVRSIAWALLQCSYGADCGPQSRPVMMTCILLGNCELVRIEEAVRVQGASQGALNTAARLRDLLMQRIAAQDWAGVGFIERNKTP